MDMNEAIAIISINRFEIEIANETAHAITCDTRLSSFGTTLINIHRNMFRCAFIIRLFQKLEELYKSINKDREAKKVSRIADKRG